MILLNLSELHLQQRHQQAEQQTEHLVKRTCGARSVCERRGWSPPLSVTCTRDGDGGGDEQQQRSSVSRAGCRERSGLQGG